ncbi:hypothetical protein [Gemmobacter sp.]|uniref:hypothetical protein n=1 Tax=Gemmobacter sp. TaxID=1898957 RepID=UPI002AFF885B|nr:hypothetical protein [Gemmobacter sp.]
MQDTRRTAILSSETLSLLPETQMAALRAALAPVPVQVVIYLRSRGPVIWSQWQEHIKHGDTRSFPDYVADLMLHTPDANMLDPLGLAVRSLRMIGTVSLVDYDGCVAEGRDLLDPIMQMAAGGPVDLPELNTLPVNRRMPQERVETLRMLNLVSMRRTKRQPGKRVRMSFLAALRDRPDEVRAIEAEIAKMMRPHMRELRLDMLDQYCANRDREHTATLEAAGVTVPPFGARRSDDTTAQPGFAYLPDSEVLFSSMPPLLRNLHDLVTAGAEAA